MASLTLPITISEVNSLSDEQFESVFGNVIELCTDAAVDVKKKRPFQNVTALCEAFQTYLEEIELEVNSLSDEQFESVFGNVIELCTDAAVDVKKKRPFQNVTALCEAFQTYLEEIELEDKLLILKLHPDLAGRLAARGELTAESAGEQRAAGLDGLTTEQKRIMDESNQRYKEKFGFPFIICARENKVQSIIDGLQNRYNNSYEQEITIGINEVKKICKLRILDIVKE